MVSPSSSPDWDIVKNNIILAVEHLRIAIIELKKHKYPITSMNKITSRLYEMYNEADRNDNA